MKNWFPIITEKFSEIVGSGLSFCIVLATILLWLIMGPIFKFSESWQLVMSTISSVITLLIVFLIENAQNRQSAAIEIKINELIRIHKNARNDLLDLEELNDEQLNELLKYYKEISSTAKSKRDNEIIK